MEPIPPGYQRHTEPSRADTGSASSALRSRRSPRPSLRRMDNDQGALLLVGLLDRARRDRRGRAETRGGETTERPRCGNGLHGHLHLLAITNASPSEPRHGANVPNSSNRFPPWIAPVGPIGRKLPAPSHGTLYAHRRQPDAGGREVEK